MSAPLSRRRFLSISAAAISAAITTPSLASAPLQQARWQGRAMGAPAQMVISGMDQATAAPLFARIETEITRLEKIFSLFHPGSQLARLNTNGHLAAPAPALLDVLSLSASLHAATDGAFDPTVQTLWQAMALGRDPNATTTGWQYLRYDAQQVSFQRTGMGMTLNGIAQGYVTDQIAALLRAEGLKNVLLDMGEVAALGQRADGEAWKVGVITPEGEIRQKLTLSNRALATSAAAGTLVGSGYSHILDPRTGIGAEPSRLISVSAPKAVLADGLSTALCLLPKTAAASVVQQFAGAKLEYIA